MPLTGSRALPQSSPHPQLSNAPVLVLDEELRPLHWQTEGSPQPQTIGLQESLRFACNQLLTAPHGLLVKTDADGRYCGVLSLALLNQSLDTHRESIGR